MSPRISAVKRENSRRRWRAFLIPHWRRISAEILTDLEADVLSLRLGIVSDVPIVQRMIARRFHVSEHQISKIEQRALAKVKRALKVEGTL